MSRKITLSVPVDIVVRDRDVNLLAVVDRLAPKPGKPVSISLAALANTLGASLDTSRRAIYSCRAEGYLEVKENRLANGAQLENSYRLTPAGSAVVQAARNIGMVA